MIWLRKVAETTLSTIAKVIDSLEGGTNDRINAPSVRAVNEALDTKQNSLNFDTTPTTASVNPVRSGGLKTYLEGNYYSNVYPVGAEVVISSQSYDPNGHMIGTWVLADTLTGTDYTHYIWKRTV